MKTDPRFALVRLHQREWPKAGQRPLCVWVSRVYQVALFHEKGGQLRLAINRRNLRDGITWDELQALKAAAGFGTWQAVEFYPPDSQIVYEINMRHLWLMHEPLDFAWGK